MQVNLHDGSGNQFTSYSEHTVTINETSYDYNLLVTNDAVNQLELKNIDELNEDGLDIILESKPDLIIFGTGGKIKFPPTPILLKLQQLRIGFEVMPIPALCRTFNYLIGEGRKVVGLLIF